MGPIDYADAIAYLHKRIETLERQVAALTAWRMEAVWIPPAEPQREPHIIGPHQPEGCVKFVGYRGDYPEQSSALAKVWEGKLNAVLAEWEESGILEKRDELGHGVGGSPGMQ